ncbi:lysylphosphatidylglycerol synthase transmembrane domain-containing protein [Solemya velum gill symbiont]|uniref:lysylphosphatidylglycerol synthase transmembrane domain-containing protein n=1 Tax=Solemya velum gill symbiont TaxID=2340 RepID=UPI0009965E8F|nr:lysylphosphatidylglycerol synthase transmembrane domain-containing protein [Solemya velum gill symbiont]OOZ44945.1 hypothetical protein BOW37_04890 [Solemya velum gill symbiont]OOZ47484.1 hypothetical protein BOW38_02670 [Solemya velum gill symbiont]OOZ49952.1 hypothetical protein BOW39_04425 [Solemya velum gill symbiont]OOZ51691.1 hypothetical protein BOW40_06420 [Solemya velum gill symbiont]OOZ55513.1 hypothetical protein BOW41_02595 [Solemya velum gill symbiont]
MMPVARSRLLVAVIIAIIYLALVHYLFDLKVILSQWRELPASTLMLATAGLLISYLLRAWRNHNFFALDHFPTSIRLTLIHNALNHWLPARTGEFSFPLLMKRYFGHGYAGSTHGLLWLRLMDLHALAGTALPVFYPFLNTALFFLLLTAWLASMPLAFWLLGHFRQHILANPSDKRLATMMKKAVNELTGSKRTFFIAWLLSMTNWTVKIGLLTLLVTAFVTVPATAALTAVIAGELTSILPIHAPGGLGTYEAGMSAAFTLFSIDFKSGLQAAVQAHLFLLNLAIISAVFALLIPKKR